MAGPPFVEAVALDTCEAILDGPKQVYLFPCGLVFPVGAANRYSERRYLSRRDSKRDNILKAAHRKHHGHVLRRGQTRSFSFQTQGRSEGKPHLTAAWCSCKDALDA